MRGRGSLAAKPQPSLLPPAPIAPAPPLAGGPVRRLAAAHHRPRPLPGDASRRNGSLTHLACSSTRSRYWCSLPTQDAMSVSVRGPGGGGGPLTLVSGWVGWALAAILTFNAIRALLLVWITDQRRKARLRPPTPPPTQSSPPTPSSQSASGAVAAATSSSLSPSKRSAVPAAAAAAVAAAVPVPSANGGGTGAGPGAEGVDVVPADGAAVAAVGAPAAAPAAPPSGVGTASSSLTVSVSATLLAAAAAAAAPSVPAAGAAPSPGLDAASGVEMAPQQVTMCSGSSSGSGGNSSGGGGNANGSSSVQLASYHLRSRGSKPTSRNDDNNNLGRVVICAMLEPAAEPQHPEPGGTSESAFGSTCQATSAGAASYGAPWAAVEWHQRFWEPLLAKYGEAPEERVTGLLVLYGRSVLHILEGDNHQLFALLRELRREDVRVHRLQEIRVPCYILDLRERLFDTWMCAAVADQRPVGRRRLTRATLKAPITNSAASPATTMKASAASASTDPWSTFGSGAGQSFSGPSSVQSPADDTAEATKPWPEQQLVDRIRQLELFIKFVGPRVSALTTPGSRSQALRNLSNYETTTPSEDMVEALATDPLAPELLDFVTTFDADYHRYVSLLALVAELEEEMEQELELEQAEAEAEDGQQQQQQQKQQQQPQKAAVAGAAGGGRRRARLVARASSLVGEIQQLARFYEEHVRRDLAEALEQQEEERRSRGVDEVARRLLSGMRLRPRADDLVSPH